MIALGQGIDMALADSNKHRFICQQMDGNVEGLCTNKYCHISRYINYQ